jgi:hypothetical protein
MVRNVRCKFVSLWIEERDFQIHSDELLVSVFNCRQRLYNRFHKTAPQISRIGSNLRSFYNFHQPASKGIFNLTGEALYFLPGNVTGSRAQ